MALLGAHFLRTAPKWAIMQASMHKANTLALMDIHYPNWEAPAIGQVSGLGNHGAISLRHLRDLQVEVKGGGEYAL